MKTITIDCYCYEKDGRSCVRCGESHRTVESAVGKIAGSFRELGISVDIRRLNVDQGDMDRSNSVCINGKDIMTVMEERTEIFSYCKSCTELNGKPTECRTFIYKNKAYESIPEEMVIAAVLKEAAG